MLQCIQLKGVEWVGLHIKSHVGATLTDLMYIFTVELLLLFIEVAKSQYIVLSVNEHVQFQIGISIHCLKPCPNKLG